MKAVIGIVSAVALIIGSQWAGWSSVQQSLTRLEQRMDANEAIGARDKAAAAKESEADARIINEWRSNIEKKVEQIERDYKLRDYEITALVEKQQRR